MTLRISPPASAISSTQPNASPARRCRRDGDLAFLRLAAIGQHQRQRFAAQIRRRFAPAIGDRYGGGQRIAAAGKARLAEIDILHAVDKQRWLLPAGIAAGGHRQFAADVAGGQLRSQTIAQRQRAHRAGEIVIKSLPAGAVISSEKG
jgi:hypothetical protein